MVKSVFYILLGFILLAGCNCPSGKNPSSPPASRCAPSAEIDCLTADFKVVESTESDDSINRDGNTGPEYGGPGTKNAAIRLLSQIRYSSGCRQALFPAVSEFCGPTSNCLSGEVRIACRFRPNNFRDSQRDYLYTLEQIRI